MERTGDAAAELKSGQFQLMVLKLKQAEPMALQEFLADQVAQAPRLLTGAPVVLDLAALPQAPDAATLRELLERARFCGVVPVAVAAESDSEMASLAEAAGLPSITPERKRGRRKETEASAPASSPTPPLEPTPAVEAPAPAPAPVAAAAVPTHYQTQPVRSGQQIYARGTDMVLVGTVSAGAEVIADGSLHIYGRLSGKALAGARGERTARIFCLAFDAELVSIAGHFRVFENVPAELKGRPCHLWLNGERLEIQPLG